MTHLEGDIPEAESAGSDAIGAITDELFAQVPDKDLPATVYHYTTSDGACGILDTRSIWATDVRFLNDASEWHYTIEIVRELLDEGVGDRHGSWGNLETELDELTGTTAYVSCFSQEDDQLSQWRSYSGQGFALGFAFPYLANLSEQIPLSAIFAPVIYERARQRKALKALLQTLLPLAAEDTDSDGISHRLLLVFTVSIAAAFFKHEAFAQEAEWRLGVRPPVDPSNDPMPLEFRTIRGAIAPYRVIPLAKPSIPAPTTIAAALTGMHDARLNEVVVGPGPDQAISALGMEEMLRTRGFHAPVRRSTTPFRE